MRMNVVKKITVSLLACLLTYASSASEIKSDIKTLSFQKPTAVMASLPFKATKLSSFSLSYSATSYLISNDAVSLNNEVMAARFSESTLRYYNEIDLNIRIHRNYNRLYYSGKLCKTIKKKAHDA